MHSLSADHILRVWEIGQHQHSIDRALTLLAFACPDQTIEDLASLTVGQRDAYLLRLRELTLGSQINGFTECPNCQERLEFQMSTTDIRISDPTQPINPIGEFQTHDFELQFRLPNSWDLAAITPYKDTEIATALLLQRCLLKASRGEASLAYDELPVEIIDQLSEHMVDADPQAEILLNLNCSACGHEWQSIFDILTFFWAELLVQAKRLLREIHTLARFYGWREADILSMTATRRQLYLDLATDG